MKFDKSSNRGGRCRQQVRTAPGPIPEQDRPLLCLHPRQPMGKPSFPRRRNNNTLRPLRHISQPSLLRSGRLQSHPRRRHVHVHVHHLRQGQGQEAAAGALPLPPLLRRDGQAPRPAGAGSAGGGRLDRPRRRRRRRIVRHPRSRRRHAIRGGGRGRRRRHNGGGALYSSNASSRLGLIGDPLATREGGRRKRHYLERKSRMKMNDGWGHLPT
ncbi:hypothetical protein B0H63DRAFT_482892 [Podospora didyma]|uniref:Uncharacterized protein n=1 Tax=Podospora didyma TaxID=330526 RepID=A0AAE0KFT9_9PEZI|nr:hypothetical protein B0H63DRAFT_482892 [Podospora didyma]